MKKYRVVVNGTAYEVELEEVKNFTPSQAPVAAPVTAPAPASPAAGGETVSSPMPGTILSINCAVGDSVKRGQVLMILEAMKMENEIVCPVDGTVSSINTTKGSTVETGAVLCVIR